jgi:hypothetical protein
MLIDPEQVVRTALVAGANTLGNGVQASAIGVRALVLLDARLVDPGIATRDFLADG